MPSHLQQPIKVMAICGGLIKDQENGKKLAMSQFITPPGLVVTLL